METRSDTYLSIESPSQGIYKEKGSKFLAFLYPIASSEEVKALVDALKKEYYDARHHCWAYRLGREGEIHRVVDDGEPSGTAGRPILGAMSSRELTGVLCVVVRYFGGTKLGTSGLIRAYGDATLDAIDNAALVEKEIRVRATLSFGYMSMNAVMKLLKNTPHTLLEQTLENTCEIVVEVRESISEAFLGAAAKIEGMSVEIKPSDV